MSSSDLCCSITLIEYTPVMSDLYVATTLFTSMSSSQHKFSHFIHFIKEYSMMGATVEFFSCICYEEVQYIEFESLFVQEHPNAKTKTFWISYTYTTHNGC